MRIVLAILLLTGCGAAGGSLAPAPPVVTVEAAQAEPPPDEAIGETILQRVQASQRAGFTHHDLEAYIAPWAPDAELIGGRRPEPSADDWSLKRAQLEAVKRVRFEMPLPSEVSLRFDDARVEVDGDRATLTWKATTSAEAWREVVGERYELERRGGAWLIVRNRYWPVELASGNDVQRFDAPGLAALDEAVERARRGDDPLQLALTLMSAWRFREAYEAARRATQAPDAEAVAWRLRGSTSLIMGRAAEARDAYARAEALER